MLTVNAILLISTSLWFQTMESPFPAICINGYGLCTYQNTLHYDTESIVGTLSFLKKENNGIILKNFPSDHPMLGRSIDSLNVPIFELHCELGLRARKIFVNWAYFPDSTNLVPIILILYRFDFLPFFLSLWALYLSF